MSPAIKLYFLQILKICGYFGENIAQIKKNFKKLINYIFYKSLKIFGYFVEKYKTKKTKFLNFVNFIKLFYLFRKSFEQRNCQKHPS